MSNPIADMAPMSFQMDGERKLFLIGRATVVDGSNRLAPRRRPWRQGEKLDSTGCNGDTIQVDAIFHNNVEEEGVDNGMPMWPDAARAYVEQLKKQKTGTLNLPWRRGLRVKAERWSSRNTADEHRGGEVVTTWFREDNEDALDREAIVGTSASGNLVRVVQEAQFDAESEGVWRGSLSELTGFAEDLVRWINAPQEYASDVLQAANKVRRAATRVLFALGRATGAVDNRGQAKLNDPDGFLLRMRLLEILDLAASAEAEARRARPKTRTFWPEYDTDIWRIAVEVHQDAGELMEINDLEDPAFIEAGTAVRVFAE